MNYGNTYRALALIFLFAACNPEVIPPDDEEKPGEEEPVAYNAPTYVDHYVNIASWDNRSKWNLSNVHDPTVEKCGDYFYMYQTDASYGNAHVGHGHFPVRRSKDLVNWEFQGAAFSTVPAWVKDSLNNKRARMNPALPPIQNPNYGFWAPCIRKVGEKYRLYYSIVVTDLIVGTDGNKSWSERAFIGLAESNDLASNLWTDKGMVVCSEPDGKETYTRRDGNDWSGYFKFNAIDPSLMITPEGEHWLIYGSWHSGIAALKLNPETGKPTKLQTIDDYGVRIAGRGNVGTNRWQALEGPEIIYNKETGYYYLFMAYDELSVAYNTRVARSKNITGPYLGIDGRNVTYGSEAYPVVTHPYRFSNHPGWVGISHCAVFQDPQSKQWYYSSQGRLPENAYGNPYANAIMMGQIREIFWNEDGWPVVLPERYAAVPKMTIQADSLVGKWEHINLKYEYRVMQSASIFTLKADKTVSGAFNGTWSFDESNGILTIGNTLKLIVKNGLDWEVEPRKRTLVYAGITGNGATYWGKKID